MIIINRDELVKKKGNIEIPNFSLDVKCLLNYDEILNLLIDMFIEEENTNNL